MTPLLANADVRWLPDDAAVVMQLGAGATLCGLVAAMLALVYWDRWRRR